MSREEAGIAAASGTQVPSDTENIEHYTTVLCANSRANYMTWDLSKQCWDIPLFLYSFALKSDCEYKLRILGKKSFLRDIPVLNVFISCSMTWLANCSIKLMNLGPPGERNKDATTLDPAFAVSSFTQSETVIKLCGPRGTTLHLWNTTMFSYSLDSWCVRREWNNMQQSDSIGRWGDWGADMDKRKARRIEVKKS